MTGMKTAAIVLAAGSGKRMDSTVSKQYLELGGRPLLYYALRAFERSLVDEVVLVVPDGDEMYCRTQIVDKYGFHKVKYVIKGGAERYQSVYEGLCVLEGCGYVFIHDAARPFLTTGIIERSWQAVRTYRACVVGMPAKDTIKIADDEGFTQYTPDRSRVWITQTPQVFEYKLIRDAYDRLMEQEKCAVTDDAMVLEQMFGMKAKWVEGSYYNIKVTTPEDLPVAETFLSCQECWENAGDDRDEKSQEKA